jgi:hypothetical protein
MLTDRLSVSSANDWLAFPARSPWFWLNFIVCGAGDWHDSGSLIRGFADFIEVGQGRFCPNTVFEVMLCHFA